MEHVTPVTAEITPDVTVVGTTFGAEVGQEAALVADTAKQISAFEQVLQRIKQNTLTERDKGTGFELLVREIFSIAQPWCDQFEKVQTYAEWAKEHSELTGGDARDTGIDLVATNRINPENDASIKNIDGGGYTS